MKRLFILLTATYCLISCNQATKEEAKKVEGVPLEPGAVVSSVELPYKPAYSAQFTNNVSDADLLVVLNSYKHWETGDMKALRACFADSLSFASWDGYKFNGPTDELMKRWGTYRDSLSSVVIVMDGWLKNHSVDKNQDFINVWFKEIDTYKSGKVDSSYYEEDNMVVNGKIVWYSQHKQVLK
jgi:hypothetical protein